MKIVLSVVMLIAMLTHGVGDMAARDVNGHYSARVAVDCEEMLGTLSEALDEAGVSWNCVLCVLDVKNGPVLCDSYDEDVVVLTTLFEAFVKTSR